MSSLATYNKSKQLKYKSTIDNRYDWYTEDEFTPFLLKVKYESEKSDSLISHVIFDFSDLSNHKQRISRNEALSIFNELVLVISKNTRISDIKYMPRPFHVEVLLMDAGFDTVGIFMNRMRSEFRTRFCTIRKGKFLKLMDSIKISSYTISNLFEDNRSNSISFENNDNKLKTNRECSTSRNIYPMDKSISINESALSMPENIARKLPLMSKEYNSETKSMISYKQIKRVIDIFGSIVLLFISLPLFLGISIAIKLNSKGPVFFKQKRLGFKGSSFTFLKFRTMYAGSEDRIHREYVNKLINGNHKEVNLGTDEEPLYKLTKDPRITKVGKILRAASLDEIPQLFNVLKGDMSLVGPRPPILYEVKEYKLWHFQRLCSVKPGITGLWQVSGRNRITFDDMVRLDIQYGKNISLLKDLKILLKTITAVFAMDGT